MPADPRGLRPGERARIWQLHSEGCTGAEISRQTGRHHSLITRVLASPKPDGLPEVQPPQAATEETYKRTEKGDECLISYVSGERIKTLDQALEHADVDLTKWYVDRWEVSVHEVPMRVRRGQDAEGRWKPDSPIQTDCWRVKLYLKRLLPKPLAAALESLRESMAKHSPYYPRAAKLAKAKDPHLLVIDLFDHHFGKYAWDQVGGHNYDLKIAETIYRNAVEDLLRYAAGFAVDEIAIPLGNDFMHFDNLAQTTTSGTHVDSDGRFEKVYKVAFRAFVWAVETAATVAPVRVICVPGNHDRNAAFTLAFATGIWFRHSDRVTVDDGPAERKRLRYRQVLLGYTHGNEEPHRDLPAIMAKEWGPDFAATTYHEWQLGHRHRAKETRWVGIDTHVGFRVRELASLSGTDGWHYRKGYIGSPRTAEAFLYHGSGLRANYVAEARE